MSVTPSAVLLAALVLAAADPEASVDRLAALRWRARVLVVVAPRSDDADLRDQLRRYRAEEADARLRDLVLVTAVGAGPDARAIRQRFGVPENAFRVILLGKDGGAKRAEAKPISAEQLFETIDAMPMRRDEMRRDDMRRDDMRRRTGRARS